MYLKSLELSGFKSFAKKTRLQFTTPITAIVGPNGSGKSNIAEAFRFVLGEQRMTQMRSKRTEDLIWNGSQAVPRSRHANVALTFENADRLFEVDFDEVKLERSIHRDASTDYRLNSSTVRLKDIVELLGSAHIGSSGHHIISQGETDRILLVNPWERKTMIEDALGLKIYQYKKQESVRKLERTQQHKKEVESLRREIAPHLKFLESQVQKVEKTKNMREELLELYSVYFGAEQSRLSEVSTTLKEKKKPLEEKITKVGTKLKEARETLSRLEGKDEKSEKLLSLERQLEKMRKDKGALTREVGQLEGEIRARKSVSEAQGNTVPSRRVIELRDSLENKLQQAEESDDISVVRDIISSVRTYIKEFVQQFAEAASTNEAETTELRAQKEVKDRELREISVAEGKLFTEYEALRKEIESDRESGREAERDVFKLSAEESKLRGEFTDLERREEVLRQDTDALAQERTEAEVLVGRQRMEALDISDSTFQDEDERAGMKKRIERLKIRLEDSGTGSGEDILNEYEEVKDRDAFLERELEDLQASITKLEALIDDLEQQLASLFQDGIKSINKNFQELFGLMFGGGDASLAIVHSKTEEDEESASEDHQEKEGIEIRVSLPRKKIRGLHMLSGGERALTSIALLFAMSQVNPPPFLLLDETDAALDEANSRRYGDMIERLAKKSQLILITHNRETMSRAGVLYGVTMGRDGVSQLLSVGFEEARKVAK